MGDATVTVETNGTARISGGTYGSIWRVQMHSSGAPAVMKVVLARTEHVNHTLLAGHGTPAEHEIAMGRHLLWLQAHSGRRSLLRWLPSWLRGGSDAPTAQQMALLPHTVRVLAVGELTSAAISAMRTEPVDANVTAIAVVMEPLACTVKERHEQQGNMSRAEWRAVMRSAARANVAYLKAGVVYTDSKTRNLMRDAVDGAWKYVDIGAFDRIENLSIDDIIASIQRSCELPNNKARSDPNARRVRLKGVPPGIRNMTDKAVNAVQLAAAAALGRSGTNDVAGKLHAAQAAACAMAVVVEDAAARRQCRQWPTAASIAAEAAADAIDASPAHPRQQLRD